MRIADRLVPVASRWAKNRSRSFSRGADLWRASAAGREKYLSNTVAWSVRAELFPSSVTTLGPIGGCKCFFPPRIPSPCGYTPDGLVACGGRNFLNKVLIADSSVSRRQGLHRKCSYGFIAQQSFRHVTTMRESVKSVAVGCLVVAANFKHSRHKSPSPAFRKLLL